MLIYELHYIKCEKIKHKYPMINILFLAPCRVAPLTVIKYFNEPRIKEKVKIKVVCTDKWFKQIQKICLWYCVFINNDVRNERPLLKHIK